MNTAFPRVRSALLAPLHLLRSILLTAFIAFARALGGRVPHPKPEPRNLAAQVERKR